LQRASWCACQAPSAQVAGLDSLESCFAAGCVAADCGGGSAPGQVAAANEQGWRVERDSFGKISSQEAEDFGGVRTACDSMARAKRAYAREDYTHRV